MIRTCGIAGARTLAGQGFRGMTDGLVGEFLFPAAIFSMPGDPSEETRFMSITDVYNTSYMVKNGVNT
jgi:hypothetical protein